jgi:hypothetical protein
MLSHVHVLSVVLVAGASLEVAGTSAPTCSEASSNSLKVDFTAAATDDLAYVCWVDLKQTQVLCWSWF